MTHLRYLCPPRPAARRQDAAEIPVSLASGDFFVRRMDVRFEQRVNIKFKHNVTLLPHPPYSPDLSPCDFFSVSTAEKKAK
jgi:hypothetical protein